VTVGSEKGEGKK